MRPEYPEQVVALSGAGRPGARAIGAVLAGSIGLAAPATAESVETTPLRTLTSGLCVGELALTAHSGREPGVLGISMPSVSSSVGVVPFSGRVRSS